MAVKDMQDSGGGGYKKPPDPNAPASKSTGQDGERKATDLQGGNANENLVLVQTQGGGQINTQAGESTTPTSRSIGCGTKTATANQRPETVQGTDETQATGDRGTPKRSVEGPTDNHGTRGSDDTHESGARSEEATLPRKPIVPVDDGELRQGNQLTQSISGKPPHINHPKQISMGEGRGEDRRRRVDEDDEDDDEDDDENEDEDDDDKMTDKETASSNKSDSSTAGSWSGTSMRGRARNRARAESWQIVKMKRKQSTKKEDENNHKKFKSERRHGGTDESQYGRGQPAQQGQYGRGRGGWTREATTTPGTFYEKRGRGGRRGGHRGRGNMRGGMTYVAPGATQMNTHIQTYGQKSTRGTPTGEPTVMPGQQKVTTRGIPPTWAMEPIRQTNVQTPYTYGMGMPLQMQIPAGMEYQNWTDEEQIRKYNTLTRPAQDNTKYPPQTNQGTYNTTLQHQQNQYQTYYPKQPQAQQQIRSVWGTTDVQHEQTTTQTINKEILPPPAFLSPHMRAVHTQRQSQIINPQREAEKYCELCRSFTHETIACGKHAFYKTRKCAACKQTGHPEWECQVGEKRDENKLRKAIPYREMHALKDCQNEGCICAVCKDLGHCEINCKQQEQNERKCGTCKRMGHAAEKCPWKWTSKGYARADRSSDMMKTMKESMLVKPEEGKMTPSLWKEKHRIMQQWERWLAWFLDEGTRVFWISAATVIINNPELADVLAIANMAIAHTARILKGKKEMWFVALHNTTKQKEMIKERTELRELVAVYSAASELWADACSIMRPNKPRVRIWKDIYELGNNKEDITRANANEKILALAEPANEADSQTDMAPFISIWTMGKIIGLNNLLTSWQKQTRPWKGYWAALQEMVLFMEHMGLDEQVGPKPLWFNINDDDDAERITSIGVKFIHNMMHTLTNGTTHLKTKVILTLEGMGLWWMWTWMQVANPLDMPSTTANVMFRTHEKLHEITNKIADAHYSAIDTNTQEEDKLMTTLAKELSRVGHELKGAATMSLKTPGKINIREQLVKIKATRDIVRKMGTLTGIPQATGPQRVGNPMQKARGKRPEYYTLHGTSEPPMVVAREVTVLPIFSELIGGSATNGNNAYNIRMGVMRIKWGDEELRKQQKHKGIDNIMDAQNNTTIDMIWKKTEDISQIWNDYFRDYHDTATPNTSTLLMYACDFPYDNPGKLTKTIRLKDDTRQMEWKKINDEEETRNKNKAYEEKVGNESVWRCKCGQYVEYMARRCGSCGGTANHLQMILQTKAQWRKWENDVQGMICISNPAEMAGMTPELWQEFWRVGVISTLDKYEAWRNRTAWHRTNHTISIPGDQYVSKKINEYNIARDIEIERTGKTETPPLTLETVIWTLAERIEAIKTRIN